MSPITDRITPIVRLRRVLRSATSARRKSLGWSRCARSLRTLATLTLATIAMTVAIAQPVLAGGHNSPRGNGANTGVRQGGGSHVGDGGTEVGGGVRAGRELFPGPGYGTGDGAGGGLGPRGGGWLPPTTDHSWTSGFPTCPPPIAPPAAWQRFFMFYSQYIQTIGMHRLPFGVWLATYTPVDAREYVLYMQMYAWYVRFASMPARGHAR